MEGISLYDLLTKGLSKSKNEQPMREERLTTGFKNIDCLIDGLASCFGVIAGRPAMGKTTFVLNMAVRQIQSGIPVAFFTDMNEKIVRDRIISLLTGLPIDKVRWSHDLKRIGSIKDAIAEFSRKEMFLSFDKSMTFSAVRDEIERKVSEDGVKVFYIDSLGSLLDNERLLGHNDDGMVVLNLKHLAHKLGITILTTCNTSYYEDEREGLEGHFPCLSDLRSQVDDDLCLSRLDELSELAIMLYRPEYYGLLYGMDNEDFEDMMIVSVPKNSFGPTGKALLHLDKESLSLECANGFSKRLPGGYWKHDDFVSVPEASGNTGKEDEKSWRYEGKGLDDDMKKDMNNAQNISMDRENLNTDDPF